MGTSQQTVDKNRSFQCELLASGPSNSIPSNQVDNHDLCLSSCSEEEWGKVWSLMGKERNSRQWASRVDFYTALVSRIYTEIQSFVLQDPFLLTELSQQGCEKAKGVLDSQLSKGYLISLNIPAYTYLLNEPYYSDVSSKTRGPAYSNQKKIKEKNPTIRKWLSI